MSFLHSLIRSLWSRDNSAVPLDLGSRAERVIEHKRRAKQTEESDDDERFAQEALEVKAQWDNKQYAVEQMHNDHMQAIQEHLQKARQLIHKSGVGTAVCDILKIMWHWPSWSQREDWQPPVPVDDLNGGKKPSHDNEGREGKWIRWTWKGERYQLELVERSNYTGEDNTSGDLRFWVNGDLMMCLDVYQRMEDEYDTWNVLGVSELHPGSWMALANELAGRLRIADRQNLLEHERSFYGEKAEKIELD
jgi:hypothetical protein